MNHITFTSITELEKTYPTQNIIIQRKDPYSKTTRIYSLDKCTPIDTDVIQVYSKGQWFVAKKN